MKFEAYKNKGIILIILVILISVIILFAFWGIYGRYPDEWEWVGVVIAGIGLAMATPTTLQLFWGHPFVDIQFEQSVRGIDRSLQIFLSNPPVKNRILRLVGVPRETVQSLTADIRISEAGSKKIIIPIRHVRIFSYGGASEEKGSYKIVLPPTYSVDASIVVVMWDNNSKKGIILGDELRQRLLLNEGMYIMQIIIFVDGYPMEIPRQFIIGKTADDLVWVKPKKQR